MPSEQTARPLRFWIGAVSVAIAAGAVFALWPGGSEPPAPIASRPAPPAAPGIPPPPPSSTPEAAAPQAPAPPAPRATAEEAPEAAPPEERLGEPSRAFVREVLENAFADKLPDRHLTTEEYDQLTDAILRMRAARKKMATLPLTAENAAELARLREELTAAASDFEYVSELTPSDFTALVDPDLQPIQEPIPDGDSPEKEKKEEVHFEYLRDTPPR